MKKKIVIFSGAGMSQESGLPTFRGEDEELYMLFDEEQTQKLMMKFQTHDPETFMYRLHKRFWNRHGSNVWYSFERFCDKKDIEYEVILR